jgi:hypothetical protein
MSEWATILAACASLLTAGLSAWTVVLGFMNRKKTDEIHLQINSRMDEFMESIKDSYFAKGAKSESDKKTEK